MADETVGASASFYQEYRKDGRLGRKRNAARRAAIEAGEKHYFSGVPCKYGHMAKRFTKSGQCVECARIRAAAAYQAYPEKARERANAARLAAPELARARVKASYERHAERRRADAREDYYANKEARQEQARQWKRQNPDRVKAGTKAWLLANAAKVALTQKIYRAAHGESIAARVATYRAVNKRRYATLERVRRARKKQAEGTHTLDDVKRILKAQRNRCAYCRKPLGKDYHVDHIVALSRGGSNWPSNLQCTCPSCNTSKNARPAEVFARSVGLLI